MKRTDIETICLLGSGPIVIGQACEFDYSGTQAIKALKEEGYRVVLVNSNPATIMTDPELADRTYIEPVDADTVAKVLARERPDALLPTLGGQTALNVAMELSERGVLAELDVELLGAGAEVIRRAEDREVFRDTAIAAGLEVPRNGIARSVSEARGILEQVGLPCVIRPAYTLGGKGGGTAYNVEEFEEVVAAGIAASRVGQVLIEEYLRRWKEFELELMRDKADNTVVVCSIENLDPMGVHTGDSITVAPAQTLSDREYHRMRRAAVRLMRAVGVDTGGSNVQFAVDPVSGRMVVIEMNPRVSRSSALASKATGFPIARIAAKLAVGYTLDELPNDITGKTCACFEPALDYVVVKAPRFNFEKFPGATQFLGTQMKSVGEAMAIGRTFRESMNKVLRSLELGWPGFGAHRSDPVYQGLEISREEITRGLALPSPERLHWVRLALRQRVPVEEIQRLSGIDPWFIHELWELVRIEEDLQDAAWEKGLAGIRDELLMEAKCNGFSDQHIARSTGASEAQVAERRESIGLRPVYKQVDTCAGEFQAATPYYYGTYDIGAGSEDDMVLPPGPSVIILGSGPNRIGQGIEFDYCCVHAAMALREDGHAAIMLNSNPETVSTDYDTSTVLCFDPLWAEDVLAICRRIRPKGVILQLGGQTPLNLARSLHEAGVPILGTSLESIDKAEDRDLFRRLLADLELSAPENGMAKDVEEARDVARRIGYPVMVRPSFVLGGRAMEVVYDDAQLARYMERHALTAPEHPVLVDRFLEDAIEVDCDCVADGEAVLIGGILEHVEEAGVHSGDSSCTMPPYSLSDPILDRIRKITQRLALALDVRGLLNVQYAIKGDQIYVLEANPRASRTVPFISKAIGLPLAKIATRVMLGRSLAEQGVLSQEGIEHIAVKQSVFPFNRFPGADTALGPEMRSTGEVMGLGMDFGTAFAKASMGADLPLPTGGNVFVSVQDADKREMLGLAARLEQLGFTIVATRGTHKLLARSGIRKLRYLAKLREGRPHVIDLLKNREIQLLINTPRGKDPHPDAMRIRERALADGVPCLSTMPAAQAAVAAIESMHRGSFEVRSLQEYLSRRPVATNDVSSASRCDLRKA